MKIPLFIGISQRAVTLKSSKCALNDISKKGVNFDCRNFKH